MDRILESEVMKEIELLSKLGAKNRMKSLAVILRCYVRVGGEHNEIHYLDDDGYVLTYNREVFIKSHMVNSNVFASVVSANWHQIYKNEVESRSN